MRKQAAKCHPEEKTFKKEFYVEVTVVKGMDTVDSVEEKVGTPENWRENDEEKTQV